ncbi:MAG: hypothetical protein F6K55_37475 [Moorea sp. SIO4A3]|nr:hypothetical protein [Moorena sp. SIO4A3]
MLAWLDREGFTVKLASDRPFRTRQRRSRPLVLVSAMERSSRLAVGHAKGERERFLILPQITGHINNMLSEKR